ncbi:MAG: nucleotide pyrophosphohydrolase [Ignavibacteriales bacterium]|nr:nucleotide pyrophosphohydrolase [Ignavibacteriales bacterium]
MKSKNDIISKLTKTIIKFRDQRNWKQFHNPKDLALAISIEASELNELFLWKHHDEYDKKRLAEELADVLTYSLLLAHEANLDVAKIINSKIEKNKKRYPIKKSKGSAKKYNEV